MSELVAMNILSFVTGFVAGAGFVVILLRMRDDELK